MSRKQGTGRNRELEGCYLRTEGDPTYWLVEGGKRRAIAGPEEMYALGLRPVRVLPPDVLAAIPLAGEPEGGEW